MIRVIGLALLACVGLSVLPVDSAKSEPKTTLASREGDPSLRLNTGSAQDDALEIAPASAPSTDLLASQVLKMRQ
jgi:hypothetical protein